MLQPKTRDLQCPLLSSHHERVKGELLVFLQTESKRFMFGEEVTKDGEP